MLKEGRLEKRRRKDGRTNKNKKTDKNQNRNNLRKQPHQQQDYMNWVWEIKRSDNKKNKNKQDIK